MTNLLPSLGRFFAPFLDGARTLVRGAVRVYRAAIAWLDDRAFPAIVAFATHPLVITGTILLLVPLITLASITWLALVLGNYTNVVSASVSSIVLMQSLRQHRSNQARHDLHAQALAATQDEVRQLRKDLAAAHAVPHAAPHARTSRSKQP